MDSCKSGLVPHMIIHDSSDLKPWIIHLCLQFRSCLGGNETLRNKVHFETITSLACSFFAYLRVEGGPFVKFIEFVAYVRCCNFLIYFEVLPVLFPLIPSALIRTHLCTITCKISSISHFTSSFASWSLKILFEFSLNKICRIQVANAIILLRACLCQI